MIPKVGETNPAGFLGDVFHGKALRGKKDKERITKKVIASHKKES